MPGMTWPLVAVVRLLMATLCGAVIGWERELLHKGAGLRTHILISAGACTFSLVALRMHQDFPGGDPLRLIQGMLLAVGFLAGGLIFTRRDSIQGLTTAAGLWVLTGVGVAAGFGYYFLAALCTLLTIAIVTWLRYVERYMHGKEGPPQEAPGADD